VAVMHGMAIPRKTRDCSIKNGVAEILVKPSLVRLLIIAGLVLYLVSYRVHCGH